MKKLLICEDDQSFIVIIKFILKGEDIELASVPSGDLVIEKVRSFRPDLILLDIMLPNMNGYEVLQALKADAAMYPIPVIMMSGLDHQDHVNGAMGLGAIDYVTKPFDPPAFKATVMKHL